MQGVGVFSDAALVFATRPARGAQSPAETMVFLLSVSHLPLLRSACAVWWATLKGFRLPSVHVRPTKARKKQCAFEGGPNLPQPTRTWLENGGFDSKADKAKQRALDGTTIIIDR